MKRPVALGLVAVLFLLGVLAGVLGTHLFYLKQISEPGGLADLVLGVTGDRMANRLALRADQREAFDALLDDTRDEIAQARKGFVGDLREIRARSARRLETILDPEQLQELRNIRKDEGELFDRFLE
jgi:hypothetical protein